MGGLPIHDMPALALVRRGAADSTATRLRFGTFRPGAAMPELPRNACLPIFTSSIRSQPPPSSYPPRSVSSARNAPSLTEVSFGISSTVDASTSEPISAPSARSHRGVTVLAYTGYSQDRDSSRSRSVDQACHARRPWTGWCPGASPIASRRTPATTSRASTASPTTVASGSVAVAVSNASPTEVVARSQCATVASPQRTATIGSSEITTAEATYARIQRARFRGTASDQGPRAMPARTAGAPDQYSPGGTSPKTAEPAPTSASAPMTAPGHSVLRVPIRAFGPIEMPPTWSTSPSSQ